MKKLMVMAAVAMAAFGLRAATANWDVSVSEYTADWGTPVGNLVISLGGVDYTAPFVDGVAATTIASTPGDTAFEATMNVVLDDGQTWSKTLGFTTPTLAGEGAPADQDALAVLSQDIAAGFQTSDWTLPSAANAAANGWTAAPEPTSGLLLLIGVAGLALRRRRA